MVGVPGKFKGCETCRLRRVKCDNARPFCRKCQDTGRECAGYERETVFIIGTVQDGGRCSSHPPRVVKQKKGSSSSGGAGVASSGTNNITGSAGGSTSRSSPKSNSNSRSASVSRSTPSSSAASSPSIPATDGYPGSSSAGMVSSAKFDTSIAGSVAGQRPLSALQYGSGSFSPNSSIGTGIGTSDFVAVQPLQSAWNDALPVASGGVVYHVQISALATQLGSLMRRRDANSTNNNNAGAGRNGFALTPFPVYSPFGARSPANKNDNFQLSSQCIVHLASGSNNNNFGGPTDSICLFLYEHNSPLFSTLLPAWKEPSLQHDNIRQSGPARFVAFPAHHFFSRVYRPSAIWDALINRKSTYLSEPEWTSTPWEAHPKSGLDRLLDIACLLPVILGRFDSIAPHEPTLARRMLVQDLLANCLYVERVLEQWHSAVQEMGVRGRGVVNGASSMGSAPALGSGIVLPGIHNSAATRATAGGGNWYWIADPETSAAQMPFADTFAFRDSTAALMFVYFWSILIILYPCIESLHAAVFQPVIDAFPSPYPNLPHTLQIPDAAKYSAKEVRELAANVCRGLDYALASTVQPDLLTAPLFVVESFYRQINAASGDGALELLWCEAFRGRLTAKGQYLAEVVQTRGWSDAAQF